MGDVPLKVKGNEIVKGKKKISTSSASKISRLDRAREEIKKNKEKKRKNKKLSEIIASNKKVVRRKKGQGYI